MYLCMHSSGIPSPGASLRLQGRLRAAQDLADVLVNGISNMEVLDSRVITTKLIHSS